MRSRGRMSYAASGFEGPGMSAGFIRGLQVTSAAISAMFACLLVYTIQTDGSPFRSSLLTPWMNTTLVDFYCVMAVVWGWICLREATLGAKVFWIVVRVCRWGMGRGMVGRGGGD